MVEGSEVTDVTARRWAIWGLGLSLSLAVNIPAALWMMWDMAEPAVVMTDDPHGRMQKKLINFEKRIVGLEEEVKRLRQGMKETK